MVEYTSSRLCFKADLIEPLNDNDSLLFVLRMEHSSLQKLISIVSFQMSLKPRAIKRTECIVVNIRLNELCSF